MTAEAVWNLFCATGAPEYYLLFKSCLEAESASRSA